VGGDQYCRKYFFIALTTKGILSETIMTETLSDRVMGVLTTSDARAKAITAQSVAHDWQADFIHEIGCAIPGNRPMRPDRPELLRPRDMPKRGKAQSEVGRVALLHALAHIELNAIDLAADILVRFPDASPPVEFYRDWLRVMNEEAKHFLLLSDRLSDFGVAYGDLPAHDGLWQAAQDTADDILARLAIVPLVLEARGLDVTPGLIKNLRKAGDEVSVGVLTTIYEDEISHVAIGMKWFEYFCSGDPVIVWRSLVTQRFKGSLKPPFNDAARSQAQFQATYYKGLKN
jgi:uncharacterized ferritin-like protein (DUF455 family)